MGMKRMCMKRKFWHIFSCVTIAVISMSGCAEGQGDISAEKPIFSDGAITPYDESKEFLSEDETLSDAPDHVNFSNTQPENRAQPDTDSGKEENMTDKMKVQIENSAFTATLESNAAVDALVEMMNDAPVTIQMRDYSGFEKVGSLGTSLPADDSQTTTRAGDIVLYNGNQIVVFYGSNTWSYTRIGKIDDLSGWEDALGSGDVSVTFSLG